MFTGMNAERVGRLGNWLGTWVQESGEIFGFHNHPVWGGNPYRWSDFSSGHATWASPLAVGLAQALRVLPDQRGSRLLRQLIDFQAQSFQADGNYAHVGFQIGEQLKRGLIHNAIANVSMLDAVNRFSDGIGDDRRAAVIDAFLRNLVCHDRPNERSVCNQSYAAIWARLLYGEVSGDRRFYDELQQDLRYMIEHYHVRGLPDVDSAGTLRDQNTVDATEPAEYYGLMISPLVLAARVYGDQVFFDEAVALARHLARSTWTDGKGRRRFHRLWFRLGGPWQVNYRPMCISGMGDSLSGVLDLLESSDLDSTDRREMEQFVSDSLDTYQAYQHPRGFFASATGWHSEVDIAPSSAWHSHDFRFLVAACVDTPQAGNAFWDAFFREELGTAVLLGDQCLWIERGVHWAIADYYWQDVFQLVGRKDRPFFGRNLGWVGGPRALPDEFAFEDMPRFLKTDEYITAHGSLHSETSVFSISDHPYKEL